MLEFNKDRFLSLLCAAPKVEPVIEEPEHSEYVQSLIDTFKKEGRLDLTEINFDAFDLCHVTPEDYTRMYSHIKDGWAKGVVHFCRKTPPAHLQQRAFF